MARGISPAAGARWLNDARDLCFELPHTFRALVNGTLAERVALTVVRETRHLDTATRGRLDADLADRDLGGMGVKAAKATIRTAAYRADPAGYVARGRTERQDRRVTLRPAPGTMALLTGYLPVEQGVACYAALTQHTDTRAAAGDERTRSQIMADTLVERLTGQASATDVAIELQITMPLDALTTRHDRSQRSAFQSSALAQEAVPLPPALGLLSAFEQAPRSGHMSTDAPEPVALLAGAGPLPADLAREIITTSHAAKWWRRLFTAPATGVLVGGDPRRRRFDGFLADLITLRDQHCRTPYCDAPVREIDHIQRWSDGGATSYRNGRAVCSRCNQTREAPGWTVQTVSLDHPAARHVTATTTPTGHIYRSRAPDPP